MKQSVPEDLYTQLGQKISLTSSGPNLLALYYIAFDDLAYLDDVMDRIQEDFLIEKIDKKIHSLLDAADLYSKIGAYQYIIAHDVESAKDAEEFAKHFIHTFSEPCIINSHMFYLFASIGISLYSIDAQTIDELINTAKSTMKQVQKKGKNLIGMGQTQPTFASSELYASIMRDLPAALENNEIYFVYQLQYAIGTKRFTGAEILARWEHPHYGPISPSLFIPIAEQNGMIAPLTIHSIITASKAFEVLQAERIHDFTLSVNISPSFLMTSQFNETIKFLTSNYALDTEKLRFEITEEVLMDHTDYLKQTLLTLKQYNIKIELDDFGTGYTSLKHLAYLPIDALKIDKSFVTDIDTSEKKQSLFRAITEMARALDMEVIAEGIETEEEHQFIQNFPAITAQGYKYAKPLPLEAMVKCIQHT